ncbi:hypothetical protein [uncultured Sphingomonas sp.]|uniref:hypothetical protein n=1 Tax=uncultured Sphingomonas sp. TaxID=158754 RepID=UPI0025E2C77D|nr:hypothetical protein [uncultured Sphingomonas sp.]
MADEPNLPMDLPIAVDPNARPTPPAMKPCRFCGYPREADAAGGLCDECWESDWEPG